MQLFMVAHAALAHIYIINAAIFKFYFPLCCVESFAVLHCASDCPLNIFSFPIFPHEAFAYVQQSKSREEMPALTQREGDATGSFPREAKVNVSLPQHAGGLRHSLAASQKFWNINEGNAGLPPAPASLREVDG